MDATNAERAVEEAKAKLEAEEKRQSELAKQVGFHSDELSKLFEKIELTESTKDELERISLIDMEIVRLKNELLNSKTASKSIAEEMVSAELKAKTYALKDVAKDHDIRTMIKYVRDAEAVDLAFLLDCTGSMGAYIEEAKKSIKEIVRKVRKTNENLKLRVALVGYRDLCDSNHFEVLDFTTSFDRFENFVSQLVATGGGDGPEDIAGVSYYPLIDQSQKLYPVRNAHKSGLLLISEN